MNGDQLKTLIPYILAAIGAGAGFTGGVTSDVSGARSWKQQTMEDIMLAKETSKENVRMKAQLEVLHQRLDVCVSHVTWSVADDGNLSIGD